MVDVKLIAKAKGSKSGGSAARAGGGSVPVVQGGDAAHAERADWADGADYATVAGSAARASYADTAGDLAEDSAVFKRFLSRLEDDQAAGVIRFLKGLVSLDNADFGEFLHGWLGSGGRVDAEGRAEFESVDVRGALRAAELVFNRVSAEEGEAIRSIGHGEILAVDEESMTATLKLEGDEWASIAEGDICKGMYNTVGKSFDNAGAQGEDGNGFRLKAGFFSSYFRVEEILSSGKGSCSFRYSLQPGSEPPCALMKFAVYGNVYPSKKERQSSMYITAVGVAPRLLFLAGVDDWKIRPWNIKLALGNIEGLQVYEKTADGGYGLKTLEGDAGLFVEDNIYFGGILNQFTSADWEYMQEKLGQGIHAQLLRGSDNIVVDALGNVVGGLYSESVGENVDGGSETSRSFKLHTGVLVYDSGKGRYLRCNSDEGSELGDDEFRLHVSCDGCEVLRDGADVYVTAIKGMVNPSTGAALDDDELAAMRAISEFRVNFVVVTASGWRTVVSWPVRVTHLDHAFVTFDLTNEMDSFTYRTQTRQYAGLPVETRLAAYVNGAAAGEDAVVSSSVYSASFTDADVEDEADWPGITSENAALGASATLAGCEGTLTASLTKGGRFTLSQRGRRAVDLGEGKLCFDLVGRVKYAGVVYSGGRLRFTVRHSTNATLYKLLLSANAISKDGGVYTPTRGEFSARVQVYSESGVQVHEPDAATGLVTGSVYVRYINGTYDPGASAATLLASMSAAVPDFDGVGSCFTALAVDLADASSPVVLDVESVPMTAVGRDGAGQPWVKAVPDQVDIDCDHLGRVLEARTVTVEAELYWGDAKCLLDTASCDMGFDDDASLAPTFVTDGGKAVKAKRTYSFAAGDVLSSKSLGIMLTGEDAQGGETHAASVSVPFRAVRQGAPGSDGARGAALVFVGEWSAEGSYLWTADIRHAVRHGGYYWLVNAGSDGTSDLGEPGTANASWLRVSTLEVTATNLLLADQAAVRLLSGNVINLFNAKGVLAASLNADGEGSYCLYYPDGKKRMEMSAQGYWIYYNDDEGNSEAWRLGHGGDISKGSSDDWALYPLHKIKDGELDGLDKESRFALEDCWMFRSGSGGNWSDYDGMLFKSKAADNNPANHLGYLIEDGRYTDNYMPYETLDDAEGEAVAAVMVHTVVAGRITSSVEVRGK